jgi:nuclear pore complex protein Nup62
LTGGSSGGLFGAPASSTSTANPPLSSATALTTTAPGQQPPTPAKSAQESMATAALQLNNLTIEDIVTKWNQTLQVHIDKFQDAAEQVRMRDVVLLENQKTITRLAKEAQVLKASHAELRSQLDMVSELLFDLHSALDQLEQELAELEKAQPVSMDNADLDRKEAYELADRMDREIDVLSTHMRDIVEQLNRAREASDKQDKTKGLGVALRILNSNHTSLEWLDKATAELRAEIALASGLLNRASLRS